MPSPERLSRSRVGPATYQQSTCPVVGSAPSPSLSMSSSHCSNRHELRSDKAGLSLSFHGVLSYNLLIFPCELYSLDKWVFAEILLNL